MISNVNRLAAEGGVVVSHAPSRLPRVLRLMRDFVILIVPGVAVAMTLLVAWEMRSVPFTLFDGVLSPLRRPEFYPSNWLNAGHAIVPVVFLIANLVNRRYGEDFALAHVFVSWSLVVLTAFAVVLRADPLLPDPGEVPTVRVMGAFLGAMAIGQLAGVYVFDRTRGVVWWKAPLYSALTSSFIAMFLFYPSAYAGSVPNWAHYMALDAGTKALMSFALLGVYMILRPIVRPTGGLGGY
ncbi:MAG: VUT family protein [Micropepsaceae bacterium]